MPVGSITIQVGFSNFDFSANFGANHGGLLTINMYVILIWLAAETTIQNLGASLPFKGVGQKNGVDFFASGKPTA